MRHSAGHGRRPWALAALLALVACVAAPPPPPPPPEPIFADRVVVEKANRLLYLYQGDRVLRAYRVALGRQPVGPKMRQGDGRTPEGLYLIDWRNPASEYHLALHVSYPDPYDEARAAEAGVSPGGLIMIHGLPNGRDVGRAHLVRDWTEGCIAVTNEEIEEIWQLVPDGTPIDIRP